MEKVIKFDVFGKVMVVERKDNEWLLYKKTGGGLKIRINEIAIPGDMKENDLEYFLDDMYHELASLENPAVVRVKQ